MLILRFGSFLQFSRQIVSTWILKRRLSSYFFVSFLCIFHVSISISSRATFFLFLCLYLCLISLYFSFLYLYLIKGDFLLISMSTSLPHFSLFFMSLSLSHKGRLSFYFYVYIFISFLCIFHVFISIS